jgi:hypothetical protein
MGNVATSRSSSAAGKGYSSSTRPMATRAVPSMAARSFRCSSVDPTRSTYTLPLHSTSRVTSSARSAAAGSGARAGSGRRSSSPSGDAASGWRSRLLGLITTSGRGSWSSHAACRRRRWKYCAEVVQLTTRRFPSAHCWRKRSRRALECSGPWPSYPCGSRSTRSDVCPHFWYDAAMYWSITTCAPLTKSPNCASHSTSMSRSRTL